MSYSKKSWKPALRKYANFFFYLLNTGDPVEEYSMQLTTFCHPVMTMYLSLPLLWNKEMQSWFTLAKSNSYSGRTASATRAAS